MMHAAMKMLEGVLDAPPRLWWRVPQPRKQQVCYRTKTDALNVFRNRNHAVIDRYGGEDAVHRPAEFDVINHRFDLRGKRRVRTIAEALWYALPNGPPWCLDQIDLDLLNQTTPGRAGVGFQLPEYVVDRMVDRESERHEEERAIDEGVVTDCFTRHRSRRRGIFRPDGTRRTVPHADRERACVCRDRRGRFAKCTPTYTDDVPF